MDVVLGYLKDTVLYVLGTLLHNLPALVLGVLVAAAIQVYVNPNRMRNWLMRRSSVSIPATVTFGAFTPFCACGTMAVVLSMLATALPWGPIMAFLTSSPLMSPEEFVLISGVISPMFAIALAVASVIIGLGSGYATHLIEKKTHFLDNQLRFAAKKAVPAPGSCGCSGADNSLKGSAVCGCSGSDNTSKTAVACCDAAEDTCGCGEETSAAAQEACGCGETNAAVQGCCGAVAAQIKVNPVKTFFVKYKIDKLLRAVFDVGIKKILPFFALFAGIGYLINRFIPSDWITTLFGSNSVFAVPLAAIVGLPLYVNGDSSIPLIQSLMNSGVSAGAMLAFMITGPGTSAGVLAGIATIMKKKAIGLYIAFLLVGAIALGYAYELILTLVK